MSPLRRIPSPDYQLPPGWARVSDLRRRIEQAVPACMLDLVITKYIKHGCQNSRRRAVFSDVVDLLRDASSAAFRGLPVKMGHRGSLIATQVAQLALNRQVSGATFPAFLGAFYWVSPLIGSSPHLTLAANPSLADAIKMIGQEIEMQPPEDFEAASEIAASMAPIIERRMQALGLYAVQPAARAA